MSIWKDETGSQSMARLLMIKACYVLGCIAIVDAAVGIPTGRDLTNAYTAITTTIVVLGAWAGGPRAMKYLAPVISSVAGRFGTGGGGNRTTTVVVGDDPRTDDERG